MKSCPISVALLFLCFFIIFPSCSNDRVDFISDVSINCGAAGASTASKGRQWLGDERSKVSPLLHLRGSSVASTAIHHLSSSDPVPHKTARISCLQFSYAFKLNTGQRIIRLHFNPATYRGFKGLKDLFSVEAGPFTLLSNFSASLAAHALGVNTIAKEFCLNIRENQQLTLTFSPETRDTYAFINGIEILSIPPSVSYFDGGEIGVRVVGQNSMVYFDDTTALEIVHRLHIKQDPAPSAVSFDGEFPMWTIQRAGKVKNNTWKMPVEVGFNYLIRLHFSEVGLKIAGDGGSTFKILINEMVAHTNTEMVKWEGSGYVHLYKDYMVVIRGHKQNCRRDILISLQSYNELADGIGVLAGFEIVKLSNLDDSLASPNPLPPPPQVSQAHIITNLLIKPSANVAIAVITVLCIIVHKLREIWEARSNEEELKPSVNAERHCRRFSLAEIELATRNFNGGLVVGRGGFGNVYKGLIDKKNTVAVKRLRWNARQGEREFLTEIETLSGRRHVNIVSLIGYCCGHGEMILVYEYMVCGTLADHLYKLGRNNSNYISPNWKQRLKICIGAARGLDYLHTGHGIIHRDVKATNVLLDESFTAKVSDFGLAKIEDRSKLQSHVSTQIKGTRGYFDPYYIKTGKLTRKSDIYAFGVILLEVLCGRAALDSGVLAEERLLSSWAVDKTQKGEVDQIVASNLREEISPNSLKTFVEVAERCLRDEPKHRPTMSQIVVQLGLALEQQESKKQSANSDHVPNDDVYPSNEDDISSKNSEQPQEASTKVETFTSIFNRVRDSPADRGDVKKPKTYSLLRFFTWEAFRRRRKDPVISAISGTGIKLPKFDWTSIATGTNQFSDSQEIWDEGCGSMFEAILPTGRKVAVRRFLSINDMKKEIFLASRLIHRNIINLLGHCIHRNGEVILVYEYMEQGTLFDHLHKSRNSLLTWKQRLQICIDAGKGLEYLHSGLEHPIIHRSVKSNNILLDVKWMAKLCDFTLSREVSPEANATGHVTTLVRGTFGYLDPEYFQTSWLTYKSDVYSYGVVLFEVLCGRKAYAEDMTLADRAKLYLEEGRLEEIIDPNLNNQIAPQCFKMFVKTAIACLNLQGIDRPAMRDVVLDLELAMELQEAGEAGNAGSFIEIYRNITF